MRAGQGHVEVNSIMVMAQNSIILNNELCYSNQAGRRPTKKIPRKRRLRCLLLTTTFALSNKIRKRTSLRTANPPASGCSAHRTELRVARQYKSKGSLMGGKLRASG